MADNMALDANLVFDLEVLRELVEVREDLDQATREAMAAMPATVLGPPEEWEAAQPAINRLSWLDRFERALSTALDDRAEGLHPIRAHFRIAEAADAAQDYYGDAKHPVVASLRGYYLAMHARIARLGLI